MNYNKDNGLLNMIRRTDPMIYKIKPGVNSTMRGVKKITDAVRASSSKAETATSGAVQGVLTDEKDKR